MISFWAPMNRLLVLILSMEIILRIMQISTQLQLTRALICHYLSF